MYSPTAANVEVTEAVALNYSATWAATSLLCSLSGILRLSVWAPQKKSRTLKPSQEHDVSQLLRRPNNAMTPYDVKALMTRGQVNAGNGYAEIVRDGRDNPVSILPIRPHRVTPRILREPLNGFDKGDLVYEVSFDEDDRSLYRKSAEDSSSVMLHSRDVLDFRSKLTHEGITGLGVISYARESIGLGIQAERFGAKYYGREGMPKIIINVLSRMNEAAQRDFRKQWKDIYGQNSNPEDIAILPDGEAKIHVLDLNPNDADLLNTRKFTVEEIARWYGVPPYLLQLMINSGSVSLEQLGVEFVNYSLMPWLCRQEEELEAKLLSPEEQREGFRIRYDVDNLQKGDLASRVSAYSKMMQYGFTLNEVLEKEGLPPIGPEGDVRFFPSNMTTLDSVIKGTNLKAMQRTGQNTDGRNTDRKDSDDPDPQNVAQDAESKTAQAWMERIQQRFNYKAAQAVEKMRNRRESFASVREFYAKHTLQHQEEVSHIPDCDVVIDYSAVLADLEKEWPR